MRFPLPPDPKRGIRMLNSADWNVWIRAQRAIDCEYGIASACEDGHVRVNIRGVKRRQVETTRSTTKRMT
jgi:hypothetical protein